MLPDDAPAGQRRPHAQPIELGRRRRPRTPRGWRSPRSTSASTRYFSLSLARKFTRNAASIGLVVRALSLATTPGPLLK
jgi:hypothetical protein